MPLEGARSIPLKGALGTFFCVASDRKTLLGKSPLIRNAYLFIILVVRDFGRVWAQFCLRSFETNSNFQREIYRFAGRGGGWFKRGIKL